MIALSLAGALVGLALTVVTSPGAAFPAAAEVPSAIRFAPLSAIATEPVHYRTHKRGTKKHARAGAPFILRRPEYGMLPYIYDRRASYPYRCVPPTAAQFFYCRERFLTFDPVLGAWVSYAPYGHLCACR